MSLPAFYPTRRHRALLNGKKYNYSILPRCTRETREFARVICGMRYKRDHYIYMNITHSLLTRRVITWLYTG